jgi:hypothetical protein
MSISQIVRLCIGSFAMLSISVFGQNDPFLRRSLIEVVVGEIVKIQRNDGEQAAISELQGCYRRLKDGQKADMLFLCLAQDIAYANLSAGIYRTVLKSLKQPEYSSMEAMRVRVYAEAMRVGYTRVEAELLLREVGPASIQSLNVVTREMNQGMQDRK